MVNPVKRALLAALAGARLVSCAEKSTNPGIPGGQGPLYQVPGCASKPLARTRVGDSCFSYTFGKDLNVDFCLSGNCCPDSNRFALRYEVRHDTLLVVAADTAAPLCRCNCSYVIHGTFSDLPLDKYLFLCTREDYSSRLVHYSEYVYRSRR